MAAGIKYLRYEIKKMLRRLKGDDSHHDRTCVQLRVVADLELIVYIEDLGLNVRFRPVLGLHVEVNDGWERSRQQDARD